MESFTQQAMIETETMAEAWRWLCHSRRNTPANADIWHLRFHWAKQRDEFWQRVQGGQYRLSPMQVNYRRDGDSLAQWCAPDALALKWAALQIQHALPVQPSCHHVVGCRGGRNSLSQIDALIKEGYQYVYRTDIRGYYRHINKTQLWLHVCRYVSDTAIQKLLHQYIWYAVEQGGEIVTPHQGLVEAAHSVHCSVLHFCGESIARFLMIRTCFMHDTWMTLFFCRLGAGQSSRRLNAYFTTSISLNFQPIPIKPKWEKYQKGLIGSASGLRITGPPV